MPISNDLRSRAAYEGQGVALAIGGLHRGEHYAVCELRAAADSGGARAREGGSYPEALTRPRRELDVAPGVTALPFGTPGRDGKLFASTDRAICMPYADMFRARGRSSPARRARRTRRSSRSKPGSGRPAASPTRSSPAVLPDCRLVGFVAGHEDRLLPALRGAMALMLRLLGIPARVAAGFVPGHYHDDFWQVTDHDAHTWVEVWFRGYGWLPFDPTPGRGPACRDVQLDIARLQRAEREKLLALVVRGERVRTRRRVRCARPRLRPPDSTLHRRPAARDRKSRHPRAEEALAKPVCSSCFCSASGLAAVIVLLKTARRKLRYLTRDPRQIAVACARELAEFPARPAGPRRNRLRPSTSWAAPCPRRLGVDASGFARAATAARYGPPAQANTAAAAAHATELRDLKRRLRTQPRDVRSRARSVLRSFARAGLGSWTPS